MRSCGSPAAARASRERSSRARMASGRTRCARSTTSPARRPICDSFRPRIRMQDDTQTRRTSCSGARRAAAGRAAGRARGGSDRTRRELGTRSHAPTGSVSSTEARRSCAQLGRAPAGATTGCWECTGSPDPARLSLLDPKIAGYAVKAADLRGVQRWVGCPARRQHRHIMARRANAATVAIDCA